MEICGLIALASFIYLLEPFFWKRSSAEPSPLNSGLGSQDIPSAKEKLLSRFILEEAELKSGNITEIEWSKRKEFLVNLYVDLSHKGDSL